MFKNKSTNIFLYLALTFVVGLVFWKVVGFGFTWSDDDVLIDKHYSFNRELKNIPQAFQQDVFISSGRYSNYYRPIMTISLIADAQICAFDISCYHVTNLVLHIVFVLLLFYFLQKLNVPKWGAFFLTLLFAVHPTISAAVAWVPGRNDVLEGVFFLPAILYFMNWQQNQKKVDLILHLVFFNLALYTKEIGLLIGPICIFYYIFVKRKDIIKKSLPTMTFWTISILLWFGLRQYAIREFAANNVATLSFANFPGLIVYIGNIIPVNLSVLPTLRDSSLIPGIGVSLVLLLILYLFRKHFRSLIFGYVWFVVLMLPVLVVAPINLKFLLEHRAYLPFAGILVAIGSLIPRKIVRYQKIVYIASLTLILVFAFLTYKRLDYYSDPLAFMAQSLKASPNSAEAYQSLGTAYQFYAKDPNQASIYYRKALEINPAVRHAHTNLGIMLMDKGKYAEAEKEILQEQVQGDDYTWLHLGRAYYGQGKYREALHAWKQAYAITPDFLPVVVNLALVNADLRNFAEAKKYYIQAVNMGGYNSENKSWLEKIKYLENY